MPVGRIDPEACNGRAQMYGQLEWLPDILDSLRAALGREAQKGRPYTKPASEVSSSDLGWVRAWDQSPGVNLSVVTYQPSDLGQASWLGSEPQHCSHCDLFLLFLHYFFTF